MQRLLRWALPVSWSRFLWRQPGEFPATAFLLGAGTGLFQLLVNPMNIYEEQKMVALYTLASFGAIGWGTSPHTRCASVLLVPKMLGKEGRLFVLGYALAAVYKGGGDGVVVVVWSCGVEVAEMVWWWWCGRVVWRWRRWCGGGGVVVWCGGGGDGVVVVWSCGVEVAEMVW
ncbi:hypothetical protein STEG23_026981 [Scotinomys teguina]